MTGGDGETPREPTIADTRKLLEANLYHHELITDAALALRHRSSVGAAFAASIERGKVPRASAGGTPVWQRLGDLAMALVLIYGEQDRGRVRFSAAC